MHVSEPARLTSQAGLPREETALVLPMRQVRWMAAGIGTLIVLLFIAIVTAAVFAASAHWQGRMLTLEQAHTARVQANLEALEAKFATAVESLSRGLADRQRPAPVVIHEQEQWGNRALALIIALTLVGLGVAGCWKQQWTPGLSSLGVGLIATVILIGS